MIHVLHLIPDVGPRSFGLGTAALHLAYQQSKLGCHVTFWSLSSENDVRWASAVSGVAAGQFVSFVGLGPSRLAYSPAMERAASLSNGTPFHVAHQHGIWTAISRVTSQLRRHAGVPSVIAPHGSLTPWALRRSRLKKRLALALYEGENLREASCLHAVAETEVGEMRAFGLTNPIAVIPNAVADTWRHSSGSAERFRERFHLPTDRRIMLFLSRITPKKGIPMLLQAMDQARNVMADWLLVIAGTDEFGHLSQVQALVEQLSLREMVRFVGPLLDQDKRDAFAAAELFVLPSYSEGAPMVILEALAVGVPVLATQGSPWSELTTHGCGWWTAISPQGIHEALLEAVTSPPERLQQMGQRGQALIDAKYTWQQVAPRSLQVYDWLLYRAPKPDFVLVD